MADAEKQVNVSFVRRYKQTGHTCPVCGKVFQAPRLRVYCSSECKQKAAWERHGAEFNQRRKTRQKIAQGMNEVSGTKGESDETTQ